MSPGGASSQLIVTLEAAHIVWSSRSPLPPVVIHVRWRHLPRATASFVSQLPSSLCFPVSSSHTSLPDFINYVKGTAGRGDPHPLTLSVLIPKERWRGTNTSQTDHYSHLATAAVSLTHIAALAYSQIHTTHIPLISSKALSLSFFPVLSRSFFCSFSRSFTNTKWFCSSVFTCRQGPECAKRDAAGVIGVA